MQKRKRNGGFTLIELMICLGIIGVASTIGVPSFKRALQKAKQGEAKTFLGGLYYAEKGFSGDFGAYGNNLFKIGFKPEFPEIYFVGFTGGSSCMPRSAGELMPSASATDPISVRVTAAFGNFGDGMTPTATTLATPFYRGGSIVSPPPAVRTHICASGAPTGYKYKDGSTPTGTVPANVYNATIGGFLGIANGFYAVASGIISPSVKADTSTDTEVDSWAIDQDGTLMHINDGVK